MKKYYVLFPNQTNGIKLNEILTREGLKVLIVPTPRQLSTSCGISLLICKENIDEVKKIIEYKNIEILGIESIEG